MSPTLGQLCYEAFWHCFPNDGHWTMLDAEIKDRWEAAAQAVLDAWQTQPKLEDAP